MSQAQQLKNLIGEVVDFRGVKLRLRLAPLEIWVNNGRMPARYRADYLRGLSGGFDAQLPVIEDPEAESLEFIQFREDVVRFALMEPKIAPRDTEPKKDEVALEDLQQIPDLYNFVFAYATFNGNAMIPTREGSVSADALSTFREESQPNDADRSDSADIRTETFAVAGAAE